MTKKMNNFLKRFFTMMSLNTLFAIIIALSSTGISMYWGWGVDFPLTIIGIAVVFPIVFSIGGAYKRREIALSHYAAMKSMARAIVLASRDWLRDGETQQAKQHFTDMKNTFFEIFSDIKLLLQSETQQAISREEEKIYTHLSELSFCIETLRDRGLSGSEVSRVHSYFSRFINGFENLKHIYQYRTPRTLRLYSKFFIYTILIILGPYFAYLGADQSLFLAFIKPMLFAMVFTALDNIQEHLENPFDGIGEDDIKINPSKLKNTFDL